MTYICRSDRYTPRADEFATVEEFLAMCDELDWERPALRERDGNLYAGQELVLERATGCIDYTERDGDGELYTVTHEVCRSGDGDDVYYAVQDSCGNAWCPDDEAQIEIRASSDPAAATLSMLASNPMRGMHHT